MGMGPMGMGMGMPGMGMPGMGMGMPVSRFSCLKTRADCQGMGFMPGMRPGFGGPMGPVSSNKPTIASRADTRMSVLIHVVPVSSLLVFRAPVGTMVFPLLLVTVLLVPLVQLVILIPTRVWD
jgi:hypothetical protein